MRCNTKELQRVSKQVFKIQMIASIEVFDGNKTLTIIPFLMEFPKVCNNATTRERAGDLASVGRATCARKRTLNFLVSGVAGRKRDLIFCLVR